MVCLHWVVFSKVLNGTRARYGITLSYKSYLTSCDYLNDLGSTETFWINSIVYYDPFKNSCPEGDGRTRHWESQNSNLPEGVVEKILAEQHHHSAGHFFSELLSHSLLIFLSAFQSRGCRDILLIGQYYKELPKSGLAGCPPARHRPTFYTFLTDGCISLSRLCSQRVHNDELD